VVAKSAASASVISAFFFFKVSFSFEEDFLTTLVG